MSEITLGQAESIANELSSDFEDESTANQARAKKAWIALKAYAKEQYHKAEAEPAEQAIRDSLSDLLHLCDVLELNFEQVLKQSYGLYREEIINPVG